MKIAHFISTKDPRACGVLTAAYTIAEAQFQLGNDVKCYISSPSQYFGFEITNRKDAFSECHFASTLNPLRIMLNYQLMVREVQQLSPDIVHLHSVYSINNSIIASLAYNLGIPYVVSPHGGYAPKIQGRRAFRKRLFELAFEKKLIRNAANVFVVSTNEIEFMKSLQWCIPKMVLIENPLPFNSTNIGLELQENISSEKFRILYVGRLDILHKGLDLAIRGISLLPKDLQKKVEICFMAPKESKSIKSLKNIARDVNLKAKLVFLGHKAGLEKRRIIKSACLLFLTSRWEAFGYAAVEAMSLGIPVVVTDSVPLSRIINKSDCGWVCKADEQNIYQTFKQALELNSEDLKKKGCQAKDVVTKEFEPYLIAKKICEAYREILNCKQNHEI